MLGGCALGVPLTCQLAGQQKLGTGVGPGGAWEVWPSSNLAGPDVRSMPCVARCRMGR